MQGGSLNILVSFDEHILYEEKLRELRLLEKARGGSAFGYLKGGCKEIQALLSDAQ